VIIDTSVVVAMLLREPEAQALADLMSRAPRRRLSSATYVELSAVVDGRRDPALSGALDAILAASRIEIVDFTVHQSRLARDAYQRFGRGSGHPARLNMGDCFAYALARDLGEPLLFKGRDFALTDIELVTEPDHRKRLSERIAAYAAG
jgi:ribonuclease VapC